MKLVDVHAHLDMLKELDRVIDEAREQGVKFIITNGVNPETNRKVLKLSDKYDIVKPALGIYPNDSLKMTNEEFEKELKFIEKANPIAIGEIGLDYKDEVNKEKMANCFEKQVELAKKLNIPVIVHSRKAEKEVIDLLERYNYKKIVMHCFSGNKKLMQRVIDNGWHFSVPAIITRLDHFQVLVKLTPVTQLLTETDAPFLSPYTNVKQNEPAFTIETIRKIAEIKNMTAEETSNQIFMNFQGLFM